MMQYNVLLGGSICVIARIKLRRKKTQPFFPSSSNISPHLRSASQHLHIEITFPLSFKKKKKMKHRSKRVSPFSQIMFFFFFLFHTALICFNSLEKYSKKKENRKGNSAKQIHDAHGESPLNVLLTCLSAAAACGQAAQSGGSHTLRPPNRAAPGTPRSRFQYRRPPSRRTPAP